MMIRFALSMIIIIGLADLIIMVIYFVPQTNNDYLISSPTKNILYKKLSN